MGQQAILYGRIQEYWEGSGVEHRLVPGYNRSVLEALPDTDEEWPYLTRHLFSLAPQPFGGSPERGHYRGGVIRIGGSLKDDAESTAHWIRFLAKLEERVLSRLVWVSARLHIESRLHPEQTYLYRADERALGEALAELEAFGAGRPLASEVRWSRVSLAAPPEPTWLY